MERKKFLPWGARFKHSQKAEFSVPQEFSGGVLKFPPKNIVQRWGSLQEPAFSGTGEYKMSLFRLWTTFPAWGL
jgi:hypothetical protein